MDTDTPTTHQKALQINLDPVTYGAFAEIGAGQEVARWFFRVGGASGTVAKSMSAYDMQVSDAIYGHADRYVCEQRLRTMLEHEWSLLLERLDATRGDQTRFFVFANTVAIRNYAGTNEAHGWMGIRFQTSPREAPSTVIAHVRMWDREAVLQQEALGIVGVNLIFAATQQGADSQTIIATLADDLTTNRIEVDMIKFDGHAYASVDNRLMSFRLVEHQLTNAVLFSPSGVVQPSEILRKKPVLTMRGRFHPFTLTHADMLQCARAQFAQEPANAGKEFITLAEIPLNVLQDEGKTNDADLLARLDVLAALGQNALITNYNDYFRLSSYFHRYTREMVGLALGMTELSALFTEANHEHLDGGILEALGRLFKSGVRLYLYPRRDVTSGVLVTAKNFQVAPGLRGLYDYLLENRLLIGLAGWEESAVGLATQLVEAKIQADEPGWGDLLPPGTAEVLRRHGSFGLKAE
ncbi:MAG: TonB-dependent receptor [Verrucomicrobiales bacterium]|nr:TonB-dependent receptor [Verrucomicrobiales bacterium]